MHFFLHKLGEAPVFPLSGIKKSTTFHNVVLQKLKTTNKRK